MSFLRLTRQVKELKGVLSAVQREPKEVLTDVVWAICQGSTLPTAISEVGGARLTGDFSSLEDAIRDICNAAGVETREDVAAGRPLEFIQEAMQTAGLSDML